MFLTRKFSIPLCGITDNTPNYCVKGPLVHLSQCVRPGDTPITISKTVVKIHRDSCGYIYICGIYMYVHLRVYMSTCITVILSICVYTYEF